MLSRTADNLYWLARYVERAEYLARILETTYRLTGGFDRTFSNGTDFWVWSLAPSIRSRYHYTKQLDFAAGIDGPKAKLSKRRRSKSLQRIELGQQILRILQNQVSIGNTQEHAERFVLCRHFDLFRPWKFVGHFRLQKN